MADKKKGLRIGSYRIKPLGFVAIFVLILVIAVVVIQFTVPDGIVGMLTPTPTPSPTPEPTPTPTPSPSPTPSPTPEPTPRSATLRAIPKISISYNLRAAGYDKETKSFDFSDMFSLIKESMASADYTFAEVEGTLGGTQTKLYQDKDEMFVPPELISNLKDCGVDMLMLSNQYVKEADEKEINAEIAKCDEVGMAYVGVGDESTRSAAKIVEVNGINIGFLNYYVKPGEGNQLKFVNAATTRNSNCEEDIAKAKENGAEFVIVTFNWGDEESRQPNDDQKDFAQQVAKLGADMIIGYYPDTPQPAVWLTVGDTTEQVFTFYSLGTFLGNNRDQYMDTGCIFEFTIQEQGTDGVFTVENLSYVPTYVWRYEGDDTYEYRAVAVGQWITDDGTENYPEGMAYAEYTRMLEVWSEITNLMNSETVAIAKQ